MSTTPTPPEPAVPGPASVDIRVAEAVLALLGNDPYFVASALDGYRRAAGVDISGLAALVECPPAALTRLALFARPDPHAPRFAAAVARMVKRTGASPERLAALLRAGA